MIWFVCFHPKRPEHWWARTYGHVSLAGYHDETWVHVDLGRSTTTIEPMFRKETVEEYLSYLTAHSTVLKFGEARRKSSFLRPMTCVSFAKHLLGVRSRALVPDRLFHDLRKKYDAEIMNEGPVRTGNPGATSGSPTG